MAMPMLLIAVCSSTFAQSASALTSSPVIVERNNDSTASKSISADSISIASSDSQSTFTALISDSDIISNNNYDQLSHSGTSIGLIPSEDWKRHYYVKTNIPAWAFLWVNLEGEADVAPHWSVDLSLYYSGWDYFRRITKFRTFSVMPEVRYWPRTSNGSNDGFFVGAHFGLCYYNIALSGECRYQDHNGTTPALGGGVALGYRLPLRNPRWKIEFSAGAGVYSLDYDIFENRPNGSLTGRRRRTFFGLDKVAVSICYTFGPVSGRRKGGAR